MANMSCSSCNKEIYRAVERCPWCGVLQASDHNESKPRNLFVLLFMGAVWAFIMWINFIALGGIAAGIITPDNSGGFIPKGFGAIAAIPAMFAAIIFSTLLTIKGLLPGTRKKLISDIS